MRVLPTMVLAGLLAGCGGMAHEHHGGTSWMRSHAGMHRHMHGPMYAPMQGGLQDPAHGRMQGHMQGHMQGQQGQMQGQMHGRMHGDQRGPAGCMMGKAGAMATVDANGDGMISKEEFLKAHEAMFDAMKKNDRGQVALSDMAMCR